MEPWGYIFWTLCAGVGAAIACGDCLLYRKPWGGLALAAIGLVGGATMQLSPFSFGGSSHYIEGVIAMAAAGLAGVGYAAVALPWAALWLLRKVRSS